MRLIDKISKEYRDDFLVRMAHHSSAIEGNTITLNETVSILLYNTIPEKTNVREFYEIENHRQAMDYVFNCIEKEEELSLSVIKEIHRYLMDHLHEERGMFKTQSNGIVGADFETAIPQKTPELMYQWIQNYNFLISKAENEDEKIKIILEKHIEFERIHPFADGNGRTGRMIMNYSLLQNNIPPLVISKELKGEYIYSLANQDLNKLFDFSKKIIMKESEKINSFIKK